MSPGWGVPYLPDEALKRDDPPWYSLEVPRRQMVEGMLRDGHLAACVVLKDAADWDRAPDDDMAPGEIFDMRYDLVTSGRSVPR